MKKITPDALLPMDRFTGDADKALEIDLAYARADNLLFGERIYKSDARLWLHKDLANVVLRAAQILKTQGYTLVLYDGLRTSDAQKKMQQTQRVRDNPHWLEEPERLLSPPGAGAHPRGMAIDVSLKDEAGALLDMGTPFDFLAANSSAPHNPAHRNYPHHPPEIMQNREILYGAMLGAAKELNIPLIGLPAEWWDYRFPAEVYEQYAPLSDADLPPDMRMVG